MPGYHTQITSSSSYSSALSPTWSQYNLYPSAGIYTPPSAVYGATLISLPVVPCQIHPILESSYPPPLKYDVSLPLVSAISSNNRPISPAVLAESAANPPLPVITLISPYLPWKAVIHPSSPKHRPYITVADVLGGVHHALSLCIEPSMFNSVLLQAQTRNQVNDAYVGRHDHQITDPAMRSVEKNKGLKIIDLLMDRRMWGGLSSTPWGPDCWVVNFQ